MYILLFLQVVNQVLEAYETNDMIVEADTKAVCFTQLTYISHSQYTNASWMNTLRYQQVYVSIY